MEALMRYIKYQVVVVIVSVRICIVVAIRVFPSNQPDVDVVYIASKHWEMKPRGIELRNVAK